jgi:hypothetical protein
MADPAAVVRQAGPPDGCLRRGQGIAVCGARRWWGREVLPRVAVLLGGVVRARARTLRVRGGAGGGAPACGPRRGRSGRGCGLRWGWTLLPPSSSRTLGCSSVWCTAHQTIHSSPPIGILSRNINQMKVQVIPAHRCWRVAARARRSMWRAVVRRSGVGVANAVEVLRGGRFGEAATSRGQLAVAHRAVGGGRVFRWR